MKRVFIFIVLSVTFFSCDNLKEKKEEVKFEKLVEPKKINPPQSVSNIDTIVTEIFYEQPLNEDYTFGITVEEWNMHLVNKKNEGVFDQLNRSYLQFHDYYATNAIKAFLYLDDSDKNLRFGSEITGLFIKQKMNNTSVEIFKRDEVLLEQPVLFGIEKKIYVPYYYYKDLINKILIDHRLVHIAGNSPSLPIDYEITKEDFNSAFEKSMDKFINAPTSKMSENNYTNKALYENEKIYVVIETTVSKRSFINRNSEYEIISIENPIFEYTFFVRYFSKRYGYIKPIDYMNDEQKRKFDDSINTQKIINETLKK
jgi:hypothetical protein